MDIKKEVFTKLDAIAKPARSWRPTPLTSTSTRSPPVTKRPQDVIGLHFFSPANVMKLLEIVRADQTAKDVIATSMKLAKQIGKIAVLVGVQRLRRQPHARPSASARPRSW
jgi:3-hydroxyacyl-CoA dehydrogenase